MWSLHMIYQMLWKWDVIFDHQYKGGRGEGSSFPTGAHLLNGSLAQARPLFQPIPVSSDLSLKPTLGEECLSVTDTNVSARWLSLNFSVTNKDSD